MTLTMKKLGSFFAALFLVGLMFVHIDAEARRMGGGSSAGRQSNNVTQQRQATPPAATNAAAAGARPRSPMMGMLGGLAAGLGLAWLASSLGLGEEFGNILMMILLGLVAMTVIGFIMRRRAAAQGAMAGGNAARANPFSAAGGNNNATNRSTQSYSPMNVGNDASARPFEASGAAGGSMIGSALSGSQSWGVPDGFDTEGFLVAAKRNFVSLQKAWDDSDVNSLRAMMTDDMLVEIRQQLAERDAASSGRPNHTAVITLDAKLLGIEELNDVYMASVEFSGMISEDAMAGPAPFREVWNMTKPKNGGSGWLVAGLQALG